MGRGGSELRIHPGLVRPYGLSENEFWVPILETIRPCPERFRPHYEAMAAQ